MFNIPRPETSMRIGWIGIILFLSATLSLLASPVALGWDESVYLGMGRYFWSSGSEGLFEDIRPPVWPLLNGLVGSDIQTSRYLMLVFGLLTLFGVWYLGILLDNKRSSMGLMILACTPLFVIYSTLRMSGIVAACFIVWSLCGVYKKQYIWAGVLAALAFWTRYPAGILLLTMPLLMHLEKKPYKEYLQGAAIVFAPMLILGLKYGMGFFKSISHAGNSLLNSHEWLFYYDQLWQQPLLLFGLIGCLYGLWNKKYRQVALPLLLWILFFSYINNQQDRFMLLFLPLLACMAGVVLGKYENAWLIVILGVVFTLPMMFNPVHDVLYPEVQGEVFAGMKDGVTLVSMPFVGAVGPGLYVPMYEDPVTALKIYENTSPDHVLYSPQYHPCVDCLDYKNLEDKVFENELKWNLSVGGYDYFFFIRSPKVNPPD